MLRHTLLRTIASASALTIGSALAQSPALSADFPVGSYQAMELVVLFDGKGQFLVKKGESMEVSGTFSVQEKRIELTDLKGPWACTSPGQQKGTYNWKLDGDALTFSKVADACDDRAQTLIGVNWKRRK
jgi:hypothetical protein